MGACSGKIRGRGGLGRAPARPAGTRRELSGRREAERPTTGMEMMAGSGPWRRLKTESAGHVYTDSRYVLRRGRATSDQENWKKNGWKRPPTRKAGEETAILALLDVETAGGPQIPLALGFVRGA